MKVAIIEPNLIDYTGHFYSFVMELKRGFEELGDEVVIYLPKNSKIEISGGKYLLPNPLFPSFPKSRNKIKGYWLFFKYSIGLARALKSARKFNDFLVFSTADDWRFLIGFLMTFSKNFAFFYFHTFIPFWAEARKALKVFKLWAKFQRKLPKIFFLSAIGVKETLKNVDLPSGLKILENAPYPLKPSPKWEKETAEDEFFIAYLGAPAKKKNFQKFVEVVQASPEDYSFIAHCYTPQGNTDPEISKNIELLYMIKNKKIIFLNFSLSEEEYFKAINQSSIVWCLYEEEWYKWGISAILLEAWSFGKPVITTAGTWMGMQVEKYGGGVVLNNLEIPEILRGIKKIKDNYDKFSLEAKLAGELLSKKNNGPALAQYIKEIAQKFS